MIKQRTFRIRQREELNQIYSGRKDAIRTRLSEFASIPPSDYFYELCYCLLTPQSSAVHADQAVSLLKAGDFQNCSFSPEPILRQKDCYIRFHKTKSRHLIRMKEQFPLIAQKLIEPVPASDLREWLNQHILGLGYKEASHFLRNIGRNNGLAILDRHILRNLEHYGVIPSIPKSLSKRKYLEIEQQFSQFAAQIGIAIDELDLLFWSMETGEIRK